MGGVTCASHYTFTPPIGKNEITRLYSFVRTSFVTVDALRFFFSLCKYIAFLLHGQVN
jgi:hypothetical protein